MKEKVKALYQDNLFRNSFYLMLNAGAMAGFGFVFWLICARLFSPSQIGVASSLISAMTLISYICLLGFNNTFVRVLPTSNDRNNLINTGLLLSTISSLLIATLYVIAIPYVIPGLAFIDNNIWLSISFVIMTVIAAPNLLMDSIFVAYRSAKYNLLIDGFIAAGSKMFLPFLLITLGAYGIFTSAGIASALGMIVSVIFLVIKFDYRPRLNIHWKTLGEVFHYSFANYLANLLNIAPTLVLPLIVINRLGSASAGYYYLAFMVANLLYTVAYSMCQSLFAEGSHGNIDLKKLAKRSAMIILAIMIPAGLVLVFLGPMILQIFGKSYSVEASSLIVAFAIAAPAVAAYSVGNTLLRLTKKIYPIVFVNAVYFITISALSVLWVDRGLVWIAIAWIIGNIVAALIAFLILSRKLIPKPVLNIVWRYKFVKSTESFSKSPIQSIFKLVRWTIFEIINADISFVTPNKTRYLSMPYNYSSFVVYFINYRDPGIQAFLQKYLTNGSVFVDAGANIGTYTVPAGKLVGSNGKIIAIEAHPFTYKYLLNNIKLNNLRNVTVLNVALGKEDGSIEMSYTKSNAGETHIAVGKEEKISVPLQTLDRVLSEIAITHVDYLKIDVEGFELPLLQGAQDTIMNSKNIVVQTELDENHSLRYGHSILETIDLLFSFGLTPHNIDSAGKAIVVERDQLKPPCDVLWWRE